MTITTSWNLAKFRPPLGRRAKSGRVSTPTSLWGGLVEPREVCALLVGLWYAAIESMDRMSLRLVRNGWKFTSARGPDGSLSVIEEKPRMNLSPWEGWLRPGLYRKPKFKVY
nr:MAG: hypothetical protein H4Bulk461141_000004 [Mitovirus sp.]